MVGTEGNAVKSVEKKKQPNYYLIWFLLFALTVVEVGIAYLSHLPRNLLILILLSLAFWKALLVAMYYMHLRYERLRLILLATAPIPLVIILILGVLLEYAQ